MTEADIISMAREARWSDWEIVGMKKELKRFAQLVAAAERKECALIGDYYHDDEANCGDLIRARNQA